MLIPLHTSETRTYIPFGFFDKNSIVANSSSCVPNATVYHFGVLSSMMHMAWVRHVCGRLESRYRYSNTLARAHADLDRAVDKAYGRSTFASEMERVAFLFERYEALARPLLPPTRAGRKPRGSGRPKRPSSRT